jgi:F420H(2)-dependent quinone reductase
MSERTTGVGAVPQRPPELVNRIISGLLRSPLHGLFSRQLLLISFNGRKSGRRITTPITYTRIDARTLVFFTSRRGWWRNLAGGAPVTLRLQGRDVPALAEPVQDVAMVIREIRAYLARNGGYKSARFIGMPLDHEPSDAELAQVAQRRVVIYLRLS